MQQHYYGRVDIKGEPFCLCWLRGIQIVNINYGQTQNLNIFFQLLKMLIEMKVSFTNHLSTKLRVLNYKSIIRMC